MINNYIGFWIFYGDTLSKNKLRICPLFIKWKREKSEIIFIHNNLFIREPSDIKIEDIIIFLLKTHLNIRFHSHNRWWFVRQGFIHYKVFKLNDILIFYID